MLVATMFDGQFLEDTRINDLTVMIDTESKSSQT